MSNGDFVEFKIVVLLAALSAVFFCVTPLYVHAEESENEDSYSETENDTIQEERINALEARLEEMGYTINDLEMTIESITEEMELEEEQRLAIGQQLELLIIGVSQLCDDSISFNEKYDTYTGESSSMQISANTSLDNVNSTLSELNENTVSGNALVSAFSDSIKVDMQNISETSINEFNETLLKTNTLLSYLFVLILLLLVLLICFGIGALLRNIISRHVL
jgi:ABC-type Na+ efflux pump permease subunit